MSKKSMSEIMSELEAVQENLKQMGITPEMADKLQEVMNDYITAKEEVIKNRDIQFSDDAYQILADIKAISNKNEARVSTFLRRFAVHVVKQSLQIDKTIRSPEDITDRIPSIADKYEEE